jgi:hypothetical protein
MLGFRAERNMYLKPISGNFVFTVNKGTGK